MASADNPTNPPVPVLEPAARQLTEDTAPHPRIYEVPPEQGRQILRDIQSGKGVSRPDVDEEYVTVDGGQWGKVRARIIRPKGVTGPLPVVFYIHGAGWVFGDDQTHDRLFRELVVGANAAGVFPIYDNAPEARYPTQVEQNYAVGQWIAANGSAYDLDVSRVAVIGESVGGCMSTVFALMNKERGGLSLAAQILLYPVVDANFDTASYHQFAEGWYLTRAGMEWFWDAYAHLEQREEAHASPLHASLEQLSGLPTTLVLTAEADVLRDGGEAYAAKLREAGVDVTALRVLGTVHDFMLLDTLRDTAANKLAMQLSVAALRRALGTA